MTEWHYSTDKAELDDLCYRALDRLQSATREIRRNAAVLEHGYNNESLPHGPKLVTAQNLMEAHEKLKQAEVYIAAMQNGGRMPKRKRWWRR